MNQRRVLSWSIVLAAACAAAGCGPRGQGKPGGETPSAKKQEIREGIQVTYQDEGGQFGVLLTNDLTHDLADVHAVLNWTKAAGSSGTERISVPSWKSGQQVRVCNILKGDAAREVRLVGSAKTAGPESVALDLYCSFANPPAGAVPGGDPFPPPPPPPPGTRRLTTGFSATYQLAVGPRGPWFFIQVRNDTGSDLTNPQVVLTWFRTALNSAWRQPPNALGVWKAGEVATFTMDKSDVSRNVVLTGTATMVGPNPGNVQIVCPLPDPPN
jgi:hypothetical protein